MSARAIIYDCEQLTTPGAPMRFWCGPNDPDPLLVQIGAVELSLSAPFDTGATFSVLIKPVGRDGLVAIDPFFTKLTGITPEAVEEHGTSLAEALERFDQFCGDAPIYSWGKDDILAIAPSCFAAGITCPIPAGRFHNAAKLLLAAGEELEVIHGLRSHTITDHFGLEPDGRAHDGLSDAMNVAHVLQHLLQEGRLDATDFASA